MGRIKTYKVYNPTTIRGEDVTPYTRGDATKPNEWQRKMILKLSNGRFRVYVMQKNMGTYKTYEAALRRIRQL